MSVLFLVVGGAIIVTALVDLIWTTMSLRHAGPISTQITRGLGVAARLVARREHFGGALTAAGPLILSATLFGWVTLLWIGWLLVFLAVPQAVIDVASNAPAGFWDRVYFTGYVISTLGIGDVVPGPAVWQVLTALAALTGLTTITVGITYLLSVLNAVAGRRQLAQYITSLGRTPEQLLIDSWTGTDFAPLEPHLEALAPRVLLVHQQQHAYPILHHFYTAEPATAVGPAIATLDEAVTLLRLGVQPKNRPPRILLRTVRTGVDAMLDSLWFPRREPPRDVPPHPSLRRLSEAGIPVVDGPAFATALEGENKRRKLLLAMVRRDGSDWQSLIENARHD